MDLYVHEFVLKCESCRQSMPSQRHHLRPQQCLPNVPLERVAIDIVGPLTKTEQGSWFTIVVTDRYRNLARAISAPMITATHVATVAFENFFMPYAIPSTTMANSWPQLGFKCFAALCALIGTKMISTTWYQPQANGQAEGFYRKLVVRLHHYIGEHQTGRENYVQSLA